MLVLMERHFFAMQIMFLLFIVLNLLGLLEIYASFLKFLKNVFCINKLEFCCKVSSQFFKISLRWFYFSFQPSCNKMIQLEIYVILSQLHK